MRVVQDSGEVCKTSDIWVRGGGGITSEISSKPLLVCSGHGLDGLMVCAVGILDKGC